MVGQVPPSTGLQAGWKSSAVWQGAEPPERGGRGLAGAGEQGPMVARLQVMGGVRSVLTAVGVVGHGNDAHGLLGDVNTQKLHVSAHVLVGSLHSPAHPVRPEDVIAIDSQAKGVHRL